MKKQATVVKTNKAVVETFEGRTLMSAVSPTAGFTLQAASASSNQLTISLDASRTTLTTTANNVTRSFKFSDNDIFKSSSDKTAHVSITSFALVNADTHQPFKGYENLTDPLTLDANQAASRHLNIRADVSNGNETGSVLFTFDGQRVTYIENPGPQPADYNSDFYAWTPSTGQHTIVADSAAGSAMILTLTVIDDPNHLTPSVRNQPAQMKALAVDNTPTVSGLVLYNVDTNQPVMTLANGSVIDYAAIGTKNLSVVANVGNAKSVAFGMDNNGGMYNDSGFPFSFNGETNGKLNAYPFSDGNHVLLATPFGGAAATGWAGAMYRISITVKNAGYTPASTPAPAPVSQPVPNNGSPTVGSLVLYNADTNQPIMNLNNGAVIDYAALGTSRLTIVANAGGAKSVAFGLDGNGGMYNDSSNPFSFNGETNGALNPFSFSNGNHTVLATPFSGLAATGNAGATYQVSFSVKNVGYVPQSAPAPAPQPGSNGPVVNSLVLYNADTNQPIMNLGNGSVVDLSQIGTSRITIVANAGGANSVAFGMDGNGGMYNDSSNPFSFNGETNGALNPFSFSNGNHTVLATPFSGVAATGNAGATYQIAFTVKSSGATQSNPTPTPTQTPTPSPTVGAPVPVISFMDTTIAAGHSIFVNALSSNLVSGDWIHAKMTWDFGDGGSRYNTLNGFNAAHAYERAGNYTVTLKLTNDAGKSAWAQVNVNVTAASRRAIYVSQWSGNDNNSGTSSNAAVQSFGRAAQLVGDNTEILFERGGTFNAYNAMNVGFNNVTIGAYGNGDKPIVRYTGPMKLGAQIIGMNTASRHITIRDITFDGIGGPRDYDGMAQAVNVSGSDITIRDCQFLNVADAINTNGKPSGLLAMDNTAPIGVRGYFAWVEGSDQVYLGNKVADSMYQHVLRNEGTDRLLIAYNDFTNEGADVIKCTLNLHKGSYMYVTGNTLTAGTMLIGPLGGADGVNDKGARARNVVLENNQIRSDVSIYHGAEHVMIDNNIVYGSTGFGVDGYNSEYQRGVADLHILNNTGINSSDRGNFLIVKGNVNGITLENNLYVAPNLVTGSWGSAPVYVADGNMNSFRIVKDNVWPAINATTWAEGGSNFIGTSMVASGYQTANEWESWSQVEHDLFQSVYLSKSGQMVISGMTVGANVSLAA